MPELTDIQWIFIVLGLIYVAQCVVWIRPRVVALVIRRGNGDSSVANALIGNEAGWFHWGGWSPSHATLIVEPLPVSMSADGIVVFVADAPMCPDRPYQTGQFFAWSALRFAQAVDREIRAGQRTITTLSSPARAQMAAEKFASIANQAEELRGETIEIWRSTFFDSVAIQTRLDQWRRQTRWVCRASWTLLFWIFGVGGILYLNALPITVDANLVASYLIVGWLIWWTSAAITMIAHKRLYPGRKTSRLKTLLLCLISPAVPLRAADMLARDLLDIVNPSTVASVVDSDERFFKTAAAIYRDFHYPMLPDAPENADENVLAILKFDRDARWRLMPAPVQTNMENSTVNFENDPDVKSYCPRCLESFAIVDACCESCGGRATVESSQRD